MGELHQDLKWRGVIHQCTDAAVVDLLDHGSLTAYVGFDPSAESLHLGNLLGICTLVRLQRAGHQPIALAGGGTGMVGDPSGKSEERSLLSMDQLRLNLAGIRAQLERFLDFGASAGATRALLVDNGEWLWKLGYMEFLRDIGKLFTVNQMIAKESVRARLEEREQGISYTEFSYMLLQAYDYLHLHDTYGCRLQMGGSDQWGNIVSGVELVHRLRPGAQAFGLTWPLVVKPDGTKFGKSETGTVWLDARRTSPYQLFQHLVRTDDRVVGAYIRFFTFLRHERIAELDQLTSSQPERREAQRALAREVTAFVHGASEAARAERAARVLFTEEIAGLNEADLLDLFAEAPSTTAARASLDGEGLPLVDALVHSGAAGSKSAARTFVSQGGVYVNNRRETDVDRRLTAEDTLHGRYVVLRKGRRDHHLVRFE